LEIADSVRRERKVTLSFLDNETEIMANIITPDDRYAKKTTTEYNLALV